MRLNIQNLILPKSSELTLNVDIGQIPPVVGYYYADHAQKSEFWLEEVSTKSLNCPPVADYSHLKYLFRQHYWAHIYLYPMHFRLSVEEEKELAAMLAHACIGNKRSSASNVPYNRHQCEAFLRLIRNFPGSDCATGYRNTIIARLWFEIDRNFFIRLQRQETNRRTCTQRLMHWIHIGLARSPLD